MREDFEIYEFIRNGKQWYGFQVEYYGKYAAPTKEKILELRKKIRQEVKEKLQWIDEENKKYYARLAEEERQRALLFKRIKEFETEIRQVLSSKISPQIMTELQKRIRTKRIRFLIEDGYTSKEIRDMTGASFSAISRIKYSIKKGQRAERRENV